MLCLLDAFATWCFCAAGDERPGRVAADMVFIIEEKPHPRFRWARSVGVGSSSGRVHVMLDSSWAYKAVLRAGRQRDSMEVCGIAKRFPVKKESCV